MRLRFFRKAGTTDDPSEDAVLRALGERLKNVLEDNFVSLAALPSDVPDSDVRFVGITVRQLSNHERNVIGQIHASLLSAHEQAVRLDGDYLNLHELRTRSLGGPVLICESGEAQLVPEYRLSMLDMLYLMEHGRVVVGRKVDLEIPPLDDAGFDLHLEQVVLDCTSPGSSHREVAFRCLDACQCLYVFMNRVPFSKAKAADWFLSQYPGEWDELIRWAKAHHKGGDASAEGMPDQAPQLQAQLAGCVLRLMEDHAGQAPSADD